MPVSDELGVRLCSRSAAVVSKVASQVEHWNSGSGTGPLS
jgi:hypothetical protein